MRRTIATLAVGTLGAALLAPSAATARQADPGLSPSATRALSAGLQLSGKAAGAKAPTGVNPYLALLPDPTKADYAGWRAEMSKKAAQRAKQRAQRRAAAATPILVDEDEPAGTRGSNDSVATAQQVEGFGTAKGRNSRARLLGALNPEQVSTVAIAPSAEDDGAIPLARDTGIGPAQRGITTSGQV